ncbi:P-loop containing nucleoside triphosphate hydrolase protein [Mycena galericulata]|nr:P-loop containing nucleoside triphosphate hydrolase protein [Mycena galericulata]
MTSTRSALETLSQRMEAVLELAEPDDASPPRALHALPPSSPSTCLRQPDSVMHKCAAEYRDARLVYRLQEGCILARPMGPSAPEQPMPKESSHARSALPTVYKSGDRRDCDKSEKPPSSPSRTRARSSIPTPRASENTPSCSSATAAGCRESKPSTIASSERQHFHFLDKTTYRYLGQHRARNAPNARPTDDTVRFDQLKVAHKTIGLSKRHVAQTCQLVTAILHLGNLEFTIDRRRNEDAAVVRNTDVCEIVADFLDTKLVKELCTVFLDPDGASNNRDDLAKTLYSLLFAWVNEHINQGLCKDDLFDLPGPQNLSSRPKSLNQFCVKFANERLQAWTLHRLFDAHMRSAPRAEEDGRHDGGGVREALGEPLQLQDLAGTSDFTISHFNGPVTCSAEGFLPRNLDALNPDFGLFSGKAITTMAHPRNEDTIVAAQQPVKPMRAPSMRQKNIRLFPPFIDFICRLDYMSGLPMDSVPAPPPHSKLHAEYSQCGAFTRIARSSFRCLHAPDLHAATCVHQALHPRTHSAPAPPHHSAAHLRSQRCVHDPRRSRRASRIPSSGGGPFGNLSAALPLVAHASPFQRAYEREDDGYDEHKALHGADSKFDACSRFTSAVADSASNFGSESYALSRNMFGAGDAKGAAPLLAMDALAGADRGGQDGSGDQGEQRVAPLADALLAAHLVGAEPVSVVPGTHEAGRRAQILSRHLRVCTGLSPFFLSTYV